MTAAANSPGKGEGRKVGVAILGPGTVGTEVYYPLNEKVEDSERRIGGPVEVVGIVVSNKTKPCPNMDEDPLTDDAFLLVQRDDVDLVVEVIDGIDHPRRVVLEVLRTGKSVVIANKALVAVYGEEFSEATDPSGVDLFFEAAVAAAIPVVGLLRRLPVGDTVSTVMDIVNGIINFIFDVMGSTGVDYDEMLAEATRLGYIEVDPTADVEGHDAASKVTISTSSVFHTRMTADDVYCESITEITAGDIAAVKSADCTIKLLAICERVTDKNDRESISACMYPALVPRHHPLAIVCKFFNAVFIEAEAAGRLIFYGNGAGGNPTASAVSGDLVVVARSIVHGGRALGNSTYTNLLTPDFGDVRIRYHIDPYVDDRVGTLADVARTFSDHNISLCTARQEEGVDGARLVIVIHKVLEKDLEATVDELRANDAVLTINNAIRIEGMDI